jgi:hypothetical protein
MSANVVTTQPRKINAVPLIGLSSRNIVVFAASIPRTEKRGSITGGKAGNIYYKKKAIGQ